MGSIRFLFILCAFSCVYASDGKVLINSPEETHFLAEEDDLTRTHVLSERDDHCFSDRSSHVSKKSEVLAEITRRDFKRFDLLLQEDVRFVKSEEYGQPQSKDPVSCAECCQQGPLFWLSGCNTWCSKPREDSTCRYESCYQLGKSAIVCCLPLLECCHVLWPPSIKEKLFRGGME